MDIIKTLENLISNDNSVRQSAEAIISNFIEQDFYTYLENMCTILSGENYSFTSRQMASTLIKNPIIYLSKYKEKWIAMENDKKEKIKQYILSTLGSNNELIRKAAASVIASVAKIETPMTDKWGSLLPILCQEEFQNISFQLAAIETLGYLCEEFSRKEILPAEVDQILSAMILAIKKNLQNPDIVAPCLKGIIKIFPLIGINKMCIEVSFLNFFSNMQILL